MKKSILRNYAKLIVKLGANVQKDQDVKVNASVDDAYFVKYVVDEAYKAGARKVEVVWSSDEISKLHFMHQSVETLCELPSYEEEKMKYETKSLPAVIYIESSDPDALSGVDQEKMLARQKAIGPIRMKYRLQMDNKFQWCIIGIPGKKWAKKVFPHLSTAKAMDALWDAILKVTRVYGDPIKNWEEHNKNLLDKANKLTNLAIKKLTYKSANGTDFNVCVKKGMQFVAGGETTYSGVYYNPNMPTEECFTTPDRLTAEGIVYSTKPLSIRGVVVEDFAFRFEKGKVVEVVAKDPKHKEVLESVLSSDEGASYLGEVALVPFSSPINQTGLMFSNTLYDENACCHLAIGRGFTECIANYQSLSEEEIASFEVNKSTIHVDFMIGSKDLSIIGETYSGETVVIFEDGDWAL